MTVEGNWLEFTVWRELTLDRRVLLSSNLLGDWTTVQLLLYVSWCDTLSLFWSFSPGLLSAFVAAIVSTGKMTNA